LRDFNYLDAPPESTRTLEELGNPFSDMTAVEAVVEGRFEAGIATERRFAQVAERAKLVLLKHLPNSPPVLVGQSRLPAETAQALRGTLMKLKDPAILQSFPGNPAGFEACDEGGFAEVRGKLAAEWLFDGKEDSR
jgi:hypothetical protein